MPETADPADRLANSELKIPADYQFRVCKKCGAEIVDVINQNGRSVVMDAQPSDAGRFHFGEDASLHYSKNPGGFAPHLKTCTSQAATAWRAKHVVKA